MTTGIYIRRKCIAADKKSVGGHDGYSLTRDKIRTVSNTHMNVYAISSGTSLLPDVFRSVFTEIVGEDTYVSDTKLYQIKNKMKEYFEDDFSLLLVITFKNDLPFNDTPPDKVYYIHPTGVEEVKDFCAIGSGRELATGMYLANKDIEIKDIFKYVSSHDPYTSEAFDEINIY